VIRWAVSALLAVLVISGLVILGAHLLGRRHVRASILVSVIAQWLGAFVLWSFAGGLALHYGILARYPGQLFLLVALGGGIWHYRTAMTSGRERGLTVFLGVQLAWLVLVLLQNGVLLGGGLDGS
jgi:hypothetical protein